MFKSTISSTPFTSSGTDILFENITGSKFINDDSFLSTLRALIAPRMKKDESLNLSFRVTTFSANELSSVGVEYAIKSVIFGGNMSVENLKGNLIIHNFARTTQEDNYAWMEAMKSSFCKVFEGWHPLEEITAFFKKKFYVLCFVNPENKSTVIFTERMDLPKMHYLQCSIFAILPWYFNPDDGVSNLEMDLINSLREKTATKYIKCLSSMAEKLDFRTTKIRQLLAGFEMQYEKNECEETRRNIQTVLGYIEDYNRQIESYLRQQRDYEIRLLGLETKIAQGGEESEIMDYFLCNNRLVLEDVTNTQLTFGVKDYLTYFDEDMAKRVIENKSSYVYHPRGRACNNIIPAEDMKKLMTAIFIDQTIRMKVCAAYRFNLSGRIEGLSGFSYNYEYDEYFPNTHIDRYRCLGSYETTINTLLSKHDYIGAIEQSIASCKSLNFGDSTVMVEFMLRLYGISDSSNRVNTRCLELPDGRVVNPKEAVEFLNNQEDVANG